MSKKTTRDPAADRGARVSSAARSGSTPAGSCHVDGAHAPDQLQPARRLGHAAVGQDRPARAESRQAPGADAGARGHDDRRPRPGRRPAAATACASAFASLRAVRAGVRGQQRLGLDQQAGHHLHGAERVVADRGLLGQHDGVGAVEHGVGDVGDLGARRQRVRHHRHQHLRRGDHRAPGAVGGADEPLLRGRTRSIGISTPRSPRATMIASAAATIASSRSSACCFSIFATSGRSVSVARLGEVALVAHVGERDEVRRQELRCRPGRRDPCRSARAATTCRWAG